jgi:hypothetical protein
MITSVVMTTDVINKASLPSSVVTDTATDRLKGQISDLEEVRRLMYVGIIRAKQELYLSRARCRMQCGQTFCNEPSQFFQKSQMVVSSRVAPPVGARYQKTKTSGTAMANRDNEAGAT